MLFFLHATWAGVSVSLRVTKDASRLAVVAWGWFFFSFHIAGSGVWNHRYIKPGSEQQPVGSEVCGWEEREMWNL
jgi:hypothetical protein